MSTVPAHEIWFFRSNEVIVAVPRGDAVPRGLEVSLGATMLGGVPGGRVWTVGSGLALQAPTSTADASANAASGGDGARPRSRGSGRRSTAGAYRRPAPPRSVRWRRAVAVPSPADVPPPGSEPPRRPRPRRP